MLIREGADYYTYYSTARARQIASSIAAAKQYFNEHNVAEVGIVPR